MTKKLKVLRVKLEYTQSDLARFLGFKQTSSYSRKENGEIDFSLTEVRKLKEIFNLSYEEAAKIFC